MHEHATIVRDEAAAGLLRLADHHKETYAGVKGKPAWQRFE